MYRRDLGRDRQAGTIHDRFEAPRKFDNAAGDLEAGKMGSNGIQRGSKPSQISFSDFQLLIRNMYFEKDVAGK